jgi:lipopolysaccharide transport system ATP-binding protein
MNAQPLVQIEGVSKKFAHSLKRTMFYGLKDIAGDLVGRTNHPTALRPDEFWALKDVSFKVNRGECVALLGPNGAGKSTMLKVLNGVLLPDAGRVCLAGRVGALIEVGAGFHPMLTGRENIYVNGSVLGLTKREIDERFDSIVEFAEIEEFIDTPVKFYSSGMYVRLGFSVAAHVAPEILLIDEVLAVGDVGFRMKCFQHLQRLLDAGTSIILVSHAVNLLSRITHRAVVFYKAEKVFDGPLPEGIAVYQNVVHLEKTDQHDEKTEGPRIVSVQTVDDTGQPKENFATDDNLFIDITLRTDAPIPNARLIAGVHSSSLGSLGSVSTPYTGFAFDIEPPETVIRLCLHELPLMIGGYFLDVSLFGPEIEHFYDRRTPAATFNVTEPPTNAYGFGVCDTFKFKHSWSRIR